MLITSSSHFVFFFFNDTATTEIYTLSLHDALPISTGMTAFRVGRVLGVGMRASLVTRHGRPPSGRAGSSQGSWLAFDGAPRGDRKSTRLNSSHANISYAVFCLKKKKTLYATAHY